MHFLTRPRVRAAIGWTIISIAAVCPSVVHADESDFFETRIRPLLVEHCYACHSAADQTEGDLRLDTKQGWLTGGSLGTAIVPGKPDESLLIRAVRGDDPDLQMPPDNTLSPNQIADLVRWVRSGAYDPRQGSPQSAPTQKRWDDEFNARRNWWSLLPVVDAAPPTIDSVEWSANSIDRFLKAKMNEHGVLPSAMADETTMLRRASLVLTGLPPTKQEYEQYIIDAAVDPATAYTKCIERLLDSPHFAERFARHWLDVVRFSETYGNEWNYDVPYGWRYRDYVIRALDTDVPFDQFIKEHLAGDLMDSPRRSAANRMNESVIGTAFFRFGEVNHDSCSTFTVIGYDILDNQLDTLTKAFQATTVACARCHDHKLDAVSTADYYALLGILRSSRPVMRTIDDIETEQMRRNELVEIKSSIRSELTSVWRQEISAIDVDRLDTILINATDQELPAADPMEHWRAIGRAGGGTIAERFAERFSEHWKQLAAHHAKLSADVETQNQTGIETLADFRKGIPDDWFRDGSGMNDPQEVGGDFVPAHQGSMAIKQFLTDGVFTYRLSDRFNGALRSPTLKRRHAKISFEVVGGRFSLARLVFNDCQLNYDRQHSIHHDDWTWVTVDWPENSDDLLPYAELLTYWDNPKFPDPLGTLGKDTENQRQPYQHHAADPRSWWGIRRIITHDGDVPAQSLKHLDRLFSGNPPRSKIDVAARYATIAAEVVDRFANRRATDDDMIWLKWLVEKGLLTNRADATPALSEMIDRYREIEAGLPRPTTVPVLADEADPIMQPIFARGDHKKPRDRVNRGYLEALVPDDFAIADFSSGRREIAELIASPNNPLTGRVIVNRVWQWVFGNGLVRTPDDFGHLGDRPSHPELLDHLTTRFIENDWSLKWLVREMVHSRAFRSQAAPTESAHRLDPQNRLLSHHSARRAEAEVIRDSLLAVSGRLDRALYGPSIHGYRQQPDNDKRLYAGPLDGEGRRSIYLKFQLMEQPAFLRNFNLPGGKLTEGRRENAYTPAQSLALLNDPFVLAMSKHWADRLVADSARSPADRIDNMFIESLSRQPTSSELDRFQTLVDSITSRSGIDQSAAMASPEIWSDVAHTFFYMKEFVFIP